jgi:hypothetical protein
MREEPRGRGGPPARCDASARLCDTASVCNLALALHGSIVLVVSQVVGYAFFRAIRTEANAQTWRMSHAACSAGATFLIALAPVVPHLDPPVSTGALVGLLVVSTYALSIGTVIAAVAGHRGVAPALPWSNRIVYALYLVGAITASLAGIALVIGAARA